MECRLSTDRVCEGGELVRLNGAELEEHPFWSRVDPPTGTASWLAAPLMDRAGRNTGLLHLSDKRDGAFSANDEAILVQLAQSRRWRSRTRGSTRTSTRSRRRSSAACCRRDLPEIPGVELAARYRPAGEGNEVGGDFYDVFETGDGSWALVVGDVCGKGAEAAAVTALARYTLRAAAHARAPRRAASSPSSTRRCCASELDQRFCTVASRASSSRARRRRRRSPAAATRRRCCCARRRGRAARQPGTLLGIMRRPALADSA